MYLKKRSYLAQIMLCIFLKLCEELQLKDLPWKKSAYKKKQNTFKNFQKQKTTVAGFIKRKEINFLTTSIPVLSLNYFVTQ